MSFTNPQWSDQDEEVVEEEDEEEVVVQVQMDLRQGDQIECFRIFEGVC